MLTGRTFLKGGTSNMYIMPTAAIDTCGGPRLLALPLLSPRELCHSVPTKALLDLTYLVIFSVTFFFHK